MKSNLYVKKLKEVHIWKVRLDAETIGSVVLFGAMIAGFFLYWTVTP